MLPENPHITLRDVIQNVVRRPLRDTPYVTSRDRGRIDRILRSFGLRKKYPSALHDPFRRPRYYRPENEITISSLRAANKGEKT